MLYFLHVVFFLGHFPAASAAAAAATRRRRRPLFVIDVPFGCLEGRTEGSGGKNKQRPVLAADQDKVILGAEGQACGPQVGVVEPWRPVGRRRVDVTHAICWS